jgi:hypothetical protein
VEFLNGCQLILISWYDVAKMYWIELSIRFNRIDVVRHLLVAQSYSYLSETIKETGTPSNAEYPGRSFSWFWEKDHDDVNLKCFVGLGQCCSKF